MLYLETEVSRKIGARNAMTSLCVWPSIVVKRGSTVVLGRTIVKGECKKI